LLLFSAASLFFNLLLKHHYFVLPMIGTGCGLLACALSERGRVSTALAIGGVGFVVALGLRAALEVALG
jgi:hypothetical protein